MRYGSVCSGIEAATVAWHVIDGWAPAWFAEIEKFPCKVLAHRYPGVPNLGDMTKLHENEVFKSEPIDLLVGGTPCQSFSVAGLRKGLADPRGSLALEYLRLADLKRPRWLLWENVPGVLSSGRGRDFGSFLGALVELGYGFAYRVLDAQYVRVDGLGRAVPQRRRRVFVVGHLGDWRRAAAVLFERESLFGDSAPRRTSREGTACSTSPGLTGSGRGTSRTGESRGRDCVIPEVSPAMKARDGKGPSSDGDGDGLPLIPVANTLRGEGFDASEDGTGRTNLVPISIQERAVCENPDAGPQGAGFKQDGTAYTLEARHHVQAVGYSPKPLDRMRVRRLTPTECERLQGFPDDWTDIPGAADGPRYKALGNSMAVNVMRWIGRRIEMAEKLTVDIRQ